MGCKGPQAYYNCPVVRWNDGLSWPVKGGHGCIACANFGFWDRSLYGVVPVFETTPPSTYPPVKEEAPTVSVSVPAAGMGAAIGMALGAAVVAAAMAVSRRTEEREPGEGAEEHS